MDLNFQNNSFFYQCLRGPQSNRRNSTPRKRHTQPQANIQLDLSLLHHNSNLADSAIVSVSRSRQYKDVQCAQTVDILKKEFQIRKPMLTNKSSNVHRQYTQMNDLNKQLILLDHTKDQSDVILQYLPQGQTFLNKTNQSILQAWIPTLPQDERKQIERNKKNFPIPRNIAYHEIIDGLNILYGQGKNRRLWPGEEALLMETIRLYIGKILQNPKLLMHSVPFTLQQIIKISGLTEIANYSFCMLQLECHWKMMITRFKYNGNKELNKKSWQHWLELAQLRGHFLNLQNDNALTQYLLKHQQTE
ncbi:unnamed protein product (macronuclear) [Paramecium tetraurelia]|uniref:Uncharacterized protein n=1 Tax=Paramecium tetraurelia TaxID=5888 RepID=A0EHU3_PARTE|nr:uncharacterized protein GSPATT00027211001 [Paramecium tetraurelia]CAK94884.1 unnamed protein product [Paramecium tetraurelia]|eukprot:XP_001462257.1 hypothetical protein (macronuclear) [Paramecium tetraurelia strain d4-2]